MLQNFFFKKNFFFFDSQEPEQCSVVKIKKSGLIYSGKLLSFTFGTFSAIIYNHSK